MAPTDDAILPDVVRRAIALSRTWGGRAVLFAYALTALVAAFLPLADHLGFELALALEIVAALVAPAAGVAAMRLDRSRPAAERRPMRAAVAAATFSGVVLLVPTVLILLNGLRRPVCDATSGAVWLLLSPLPTAVLAAALGAAARARAGSALKAALLVAAVELASLAVSLWSIYAGPAFFMYDHFFGYWPGPLYDETVLVAAPLLVFRAMTLLWALAAILACGMADPRETTARRSAIGAGLLAVLLLATSLRFSTELGYRTTDRSLAAALGAEKRVDDLVLHFPREWPPEQVDELVRDARFRAFQVERLLKVRPTVPVTVWMYRSAQEKRRLVGAAQTSFSKPWRHEVHVHWMGYPSPVLRHELVHAFAAEFARGLFKVPGGLLPNAPLTEGLAVAFQGEPAEMTRVQWAKAMRDLQLAPDMSALFSSAGFYAAAPARAYAYAGAFIQYLDGRFGIDAVKRLYATGELSTLGDPKELVAGFEAKLDTLVLTPAEHAAAERRFRRPSVFHRRCPREVSLVTEEADASLERNNFPKALSLYDDACRMEPDDPALLRNLLTAALRANNPASIDAAARRLFAHPKLDDSLRASALVELGDAAWKANALAQAEASYAQAAKLAVDPATHRSAVAHERAVQDPARAKLLEPLFVKGDAGVEELFAMNDYLAAHPDDALVTYLLGRQLVQRDAVARGLALLSRLSPQALGDEEFSRESWRLQMRARAELHDCAGVQPESSPGAQPADRAFAEDWRERCEFEVARGLPPRSK